jgi:phenylacetate-CoA ligase
MSIELNSTGGSTGVPLNFYQDRNYKDWAAAATIRTWRHYVNCAPTDLEAVFWGAIRDIGKGFRLHNELHRILRDRVLLLNTFDLDSTLLRRYLFFYNLISPPLVRGYASSLHYVAEFVETHALKLHVPRAVISSTEVLHSRMRTTIERVFRAPVFDSYGCREVSQIATECNHHDGLHISVENQYVELVENDLVITNLNNYAMPLIRYRVGDLASAITTDPCRCGRTLPRIVKLIGRDNDNIELPTGKVINGEFFEFLFFGMTTVIQYQVVYSKSDQKMTVKLHLRDTTENIPALVRSRMKESFGFDNVEIVETDVFDRTPTGKLRFVFTVD